MTANIFDLGQKGLQPLKVCFCEIQSIWYFLGSSIRESVLNEKWDILIRDIISRIISKFSTWRKEKSEVQKKIYILSD